MARVGVGGNNHTSFTIFTSGYGLPDKEVSCEYFIPVIASLCIVIFYEYTCIAFNRQVSYQRNEIEEVVSLF